jgi:acetolactate synthase-1/2/3 large subunit
MVNIDPSEMESSADPRSGGMPRTPGRFIREMIKQARRIERPDRSAWLDRCRDWKERYPFVRPTHRGDAAGISVYAFSEFSRRN